MLGIFVFDNFKSFHITHFFIFFYQILLIFLFFLTLIIYLEKLLLQVLSFILKQF